MNRSILFLTIIFFTFYLNSATGTVKLSNNIKEQVEDGSKQELVQDNRGLFVLPNAFFIEKLGDYNSVDININRIMAITETFFEKIKIRETPSHIDDNFKFIYNTSIKKQITGRSNELLFWYLGVVDISGIGANIPIELHFRDSILVGTISLEKIDEWVISDIQLEKKEKGIFDPSSPLN
ncbi:MAG: hypothetical protein B6229_01265 [Spirochaetaceae bacterium 4572_7]|nr:MAG: hypothetical protein B6229_01265 [Spirochaetaceae bacterium 4572_7]